jgi:hypothetical protein
MDKVISKTTTANKLFIKEKCVTMKDICQVLEYSDRSVQRLLKKLGYYSSFTHNGKWYTLEHIPDFDENGLWFYQGIGFSKWRNLTATILYLVENSVKGLTASELSSILSPSCPPILNKIHKAGKINRVKTPRGFIYISMNSATKKGQLNNLDKADILQHLSDSDKIIILAEHIRTPNRTCSELALQVKKKSRMNCSTEMIKSLFVQLGLEKKILQKHQISC